MKFRIAVFLLIGLWAISVSRASLVAEQAASAKTVWDGVYSEEQAKRGEKAYAEACSECHGQDLAGDGFAPALAGADFGNSWNSLSLGDLFDRIRISMPPANPNAVSNAQKADIVAYILKSNKIPAGTTDLPAQAESLKAIQYLTAKPAQ